MSAGAPTKGGLNRQQLPRYYNVTASALTITTNLYANKVITLNLASGQTITLPPSSGSGNVYTFVLGTTVTSNTTVIKVANTADAFQGYSMVISDDGTGGPVKGFSAVAGTDDTVTLNGTTTGGYVGDQIVVRDVALNRFQVTVTGKATGTEATPFSATV